MRDKIKNDGLEELNDSLLKSSDLLKASINKTSDPDILENIKFGLVSDSIQRVILLYSLGVEKKELLLALDEAINVFSEYFEWEGVELSYGDYDYMVWMVSLGILCDIDLEDFNRITAVIQRDGAQDKLLDFIIKSKQEDWEGNSDTYLQEIPYAETANIASAEDIQYYLDKVWYQGHDEAYWHDLHKNTKANRYFGYWAWEVAAIAKIKGIDDSSLKDHKYYPYDAVHW